MPAWHFTLYKSDGNKKTGRHLYRVCITYKYVFKCEPHSLYKIYIQHLMQNNILNFTLSRSFATCVNVKIDACCHFHIYILQHVCNSLDFISIHCTFETSKITIQTDPTFIHIYTELSLIPHTKFYSNRSGRVV